MRNQAINWTEGMFLRPQHFQANDRHLRELLSTADRLDQACDYYRRYEPGSPVPLLLERAKRLVSMDFMQIIEDLAPDGAAQAAKVCGVQEND